MIGVVRQSRVVPAEILFSAWVGGGHHVACVGGKVKERMLENLARMVASGELRDGIMHVLVLLVFQLQRDNRQAIEEENKINLLISLAEVEMRAKGDTILAVFTGGSTFAGTGLGVVEPEFQPAHLQPVTQEHP